MTLSALARTARRISQSSTWRACGSFRTCTSGVPAMAWSRRWPGVPRWRATDAPTCAGIYAPGTTAPDPGRGADCRDRAWRVCAARLRGRARADPDRDRLGGATRGHGAPRRWRQRGGACGWCRCPARRCSMLRTRPTASRCCPRAYGRASRSRPESATSGTAMSAPTAAVLGIDRFGESAPAELLFEHFGIHRRAHLRDCAQSC